MSSDRTYEEQIKFTGEQLGGSFYENAKTKRSAVASFHLSLDSYAHLIAIDYLVDEAETKANLRQVAMTYFQQMMGSNVQLIQALNQCTEGETNESSRMV